MIHDNAEAIRKLEGLCEALGLQHEPQDWGIVNADAGRLSEFMSYYEATEGLSATEKFELGGLILASANEYLLQGARDIPAAVSVFLVQNRTAFESQLEYWTNLQDTGEFPLAEWLRHNLLPSIQRTPRDGG